MGGDDNARRAAHPRPRGYDHVLLDLDGCLWIGDRAVPRAPEAVAALRAAGKRLAFLTNDARHAPEELVRKLWRLGFQASVQEVVTCGAALQFVLASRPDKGAAFVDRRPAPRRPRRRGRHARGQQHGVRHRAPTSWWSPSTTTCTTASCGSPRRPCCAARS